MSIELLHSDDDSIIIVLRKWLGQLEKILGLEAIILELF